MERISKGNGYSICFATDEHYVSYLRVTLFSLLCNRNQEREYDIVVLHTGLTEEHIRSFFALTEPYNADNYRKDALKMHHPEQYFNAGVVLFDLTHCRPDHTFQKAYQILTEKKYCYNDQDVLNMLFDGKVTMLPAKWNYQNCVEAFCDRYPDIYGPMYQDVRGEKPAIIHYVSSYKPWKCTVAMDSYYHTYVDKLEHFVEG